MNERLQYQGHLREKEIESQELRIRIEGLRDSIRQKLDPFVEVEHIAGAVVAQQAMELAQAIIQYEECWKKINAIKRALGLV